MRFFRRWSSPALAGLLAIAMQAAFLLAHAHVHPHVSAPIAMQGWGKGTAIACRALVRPAGCGPVIPHDHDDCPLCWSLAASGAGILPAPLWLTAADVPTPTLRPPTAVPALAEAGGRSHFQPRAPPAA